MNDARGSSKCQHPAKNETGIESRQNYTTKAEEDLCSLWDGREGDDEL